MAAKKTVPAPAAVYQEAADLLAGRWPGLLVILFLSAIAGLLVGIGHTLVGKASTLAFTLLWLPAVAARFWTAKVGLVATVQVAQDQPIDWKEAWSWDGRVLSTALAALATALGMALALSPMLLFLLIHAVNQSFTTVGLALLSSLFCLPAALWVFFRLVPSQYLAAAGHPASVERALEVTRGRVGDSLSLSLRAALPILGVGAVCLLGVLMKDLISVGVVILLCLVALPFILNFALAAALAHARWAVLLDQAGPAKGRDKPLSAQDRRQEALLRQAPASVRAKAARGSARSTAKERSTRKAAPKNSLKKKPAAKKTRKAS
jgi:hypothetical protein